MAMTDSRDRREAALDWLVRTNDPEFDAWPGFTAWLERDRANPDAYHEGAQGEAEMPPLVERASAPKPRSSKVLRPVLAWTGAAAVAAALAIVVTPTVMPVDSATAPGKTTVVSRGG